MMSLPIIGWLIIGSRGGIAGFLERKSTDLSHALTVLEDTGMIVREPDAFHGKRAPPTASPNPS